MVATPSSNLGFQNFFQATLTGDITASAVDIPLDNIPNATEGFLVIDPDSASLREVIFYTSKTSLKVVCPSVADGRGQGDTTANAHSTGTTVIMAPVAEYFEAMQSLFTTTPQGWTGVATTISSVTNNGNRSYTLSTSNDQSAVLPLGARLRTTRTANAPNQTTSLNGTNQYWVKTSPNKFTFTDDFAIGVWVKLSAYQSVNDQYIVSRFNGTSGWGLQVNAPGTVRLIAWNGGASNVSYITSSQSIPLNRWVYISAQLDMSSFSASSTTSYIMFDGVDVPAVVARSGTNPTALVQAGNLEVGSVNGGLTPFSGKVSQLAIFSAKVTQSTFRTYMSQGLSGSETNLASAFSFSNSTADLNTTSPNDLSAGSGSPNATNADSPFGGQANGTISQTLDYGIVTAVDASSITVHVAEGCAIPTSGGISSVSYSNNRTPYGFPPESSRWKVITLTRAAGGQGSPAANTAYNPTNTQIIPPIGKWKMYYNTPFQIERATGVLDGALYLATSNASFTGEIPESRSAVYISSASNYLLMPQVSKSFVYSTATQQALYSNFYTAQSGGTAVGPRGDWMLAGYWIEAENAYL